jgi:hypothetical protein
MPGRQYALSVQGYKHRLATMLTGSPMANVWDARECAFNCLMVCEPQIEQNIRICLERVFTLVQNLDCLAYDYAQSTGACELHWDKATSQTQYIPATGYNAYDRIL